MRPYADTNFFTRLYLPLEETSKAEAQLNEAKSAGTELLPAIWLHRIEFANALQLHVFHGKQAGHVRITAEQAAAAQESFRADTLAEEFLCLTHVGESDLVHQAEELAFRHTANHGFRTYDLLHVAAALLLNCDVFWSFDRRASDLAKREGLCVTA